MMGIDAGAGGRSGRARREASALKPARATPAGQRPSTAHGVRVLPIGLAADDGAELVVVCQEAHFDDAASGGMPVPVRSGPWGLVHVIDLGSGPLKGA